MFKACKACKNPENCEMVAKLEEIDRAMTMLNRKYENLLKKMEFDEQTKYSKFPPQ